LSPIRSGSCTTGFLAWCSRSTLIFCVFGRLGLLHDRCMDPREQPIGEVVRAGFLCIRHGHSHSKDHRRPALFHRLHCNAYGCSCSSSADMPVSPLGGVNRSARQGCGTHAHGVRVPHLQSVLRFRGSPQHPLDAALGAKLIDALIVFVSVVWWPARFPATQISIAEKGRPAVCATSWCAWGFTPKKSSKAARSPALG